MLVDSESQYVSQLVSRTHSACGTDPQTAWLFSNGSIRMLVIKGGPVIAFIIQMSLIPANYAAKQHTLSHCTGVRMSLCRGNSAVSL